MQLCRQTVKTNIRKQKTISDKVYIAMFLTVEQNFVASFIISSNLSNHSIISINKIMQPRDAESKFPDTTTASSSASRTSRQLKLTGSVAHMETS
jgi:hypothetical protein